MNQVRERGQNGMNRSYITPPHHRRSNKKGRNFKGKNSEFGGKIIPAREKLPGS